MSKPEKVEANIAALKEAEGIIARSEFPAFLRSLRRSSVEGSDMKIYLPKSFCCEHLLDYDETVTLINERGRKYKVAFYTCHYRLSAGWRRFSHENRLRKDDVLVFLLIGHFKFKVHIIRPRAFRTNGSAMTPSSVKPPPQPIPRENVEKMALSPDLEASEPEDVSVEQEVHIVGARAYRTNGSTQKPGSAKDCWKPPPQHIPQENIGKLALEPDLEASQPENMSKDFLLFSEEDVVLSSRPPLDFKDVHNIDDFSIVINGLNIDGMVPKEVRICYYELCCSQNSYLHDNILRDVNNSKWAVVIITRIVDIANALRASTYSTPLTEYASWSKLLYSFEVLGMKVWFLRDRVNQLGRWSVVDSREDELLRMQVVEAERELLGVEEKIPTLETELSQLKQKREGLKVGIEAKKTSLEERKHLFQIMVNAPW